MIDPSLGLSKYKTNREKCYDTKNKIFFLDARVRKKIFFYFNGHVDQLPCNFEFFSYLLLQFWYAD